MVVLIDTAALPPSERDDALSDVFSAASGPTRVTHAVPDLHVRNKTESWNVGERNTIIRTADTGLRLSRSPRVLRACGRELFAMTFQREGTSIYLNGDDVTLRGPGTLILQDISRSYEFAFDGHGDNFSFLMTYDDLGMPVAEATKAARSIETSPFYELAQDNFARLSAAASKLSSDSAASAHLAVATVQLTRALLASTDVVGAASDDIVHDTLSTTAAAYTRRHWNDLELSSAQIAASWDMPLCDIRRVVVGDGQTIDDHIAERRYSASQRPSGSSAERALGSPRPPGVDL